MMAVVYRPAFLFAVSLSLLPACDPTAGTGADFDTIATASASVGDPSSPTEGGPDSEGGSETDPGPTTTTTGPDAETSDTAGDTDATASTSDTIGEGPSCDGVSNAIVVDIDETLTVSDLEWLSQLLLNGPPPTMRAGANELIQAYAGRGYYVFYLTARPEDAAIIGSGEMARAATERWLLDNDFPRGERTDLVLAPTTVVGTASQDYKAAALMDKQDEGWVFDYAYGNADTDIGAYEDAGIDKASTFIIGPQAGMMGTQAITEPDYTAHIATQVPMLATVCDPDA